MKKQFFIFVGVVFCVLFNASAFGDQLSVFDKAVYQGSCFEGNYDNVKKMVDKDKNLVNSLSDNYKSDENKYEVPMFAMVINGCCRRPNQTSCGSNRKSDMAKLFIEKGADVNSLVGNPMIESGNTLLDYVRYYKTKSNWCPSGSDTTECDKIEKLLVDAGAKTYAELHPESSSDATKIETPKIENSAAAGVIPVATDTEQVKEDSPKKEDVLVKETKDTPTTKPSNVKQNKAQKESQNSTDEEKANALEEKQEAYDKAHETEQSTANKLLGGLSTAATGIGGMQLMQGLAEQSSDKDAAADMAAYIETMRCTYGDGKQVKAGPEEIELPGANDAELMKLRSEYLALAADLKERKEALGMKPGIESETILDRSATGLYDDENVGITSGNYASLYRAQALNSESDQAKIDDAKSTSGNRVKYGAIAAGVGVVGGIVGNSLINGKLGEMIKSAKEKKDADKNEKQALEKLKKCLKEAGAKKTSDLKFENFTPSVLHLEKISCSGSDWKDKVKGKDATKLFADTTDEATIKDTLIKNFGVVIAGKLLDEDLQEKQQEQNQQQEQAGQEQIPVVTQQQEQEQNSQEEQKQEEPKQEEKKQEEPKQEEKKQEEEKQKTPQQKTTNQKKPQPKQEKKQEQQKPQPKQEQKPQPKQEQKNDAGKVAERKTPKTNVAKTQENIKTFEDVQVNLEQGKKIVELWAAKNNKKNFSYKSEDTSSVGQDYLTYQDDAHIYTFEFDDLTESMSGTRKEGIGTAVCLIYKGTPSTGADFIQCNNVNCSEFISATQKIDSSIKGWSAPDLPYGQKTTMYTECRMSTGSSLF